jgi:single-strand DNA-binding protein
MASYNRVILVGNLARDPELRYTPSGTAVTDLRLAVSEKRGRGENRREETLFTDVTVWDRQAENCCEYLSKGRAILVEGRLVMDEWEDRESGQKRTRLKIVANTVQFLGGGEGGGGRSGGGGRARPPRRQNGEGGGGGSGGGGGGGRGGDGFENDFDGGDDIPF